MDAALLTIISSSRPDQRWRSTKSMGLVRSETPFRFAMSITQKRPRKVGAFLQEPRSDRHRCVQGASCFGPAYEFALIVNADLRKRKIRDRVPITFVTSEPYIGHLGLGGVGDTKGVLESAFRDRDIKWVTNAKLDRAMLSPGRHRGWEDGQRSVSTACHPNSRCSSQGFAEFLHDGRGWKGLAGLANPRGFILVDKCQRNPTFKNIFAVGVGIAIPPFEPTPVPVGVPKTGYMIESMVAAVAENIRDLIAGKQPRSEATWSAVCLADFATAAWLLSPCANPAA